MTKNDNNDSFTDSFAQAYSEATKEAIDEVVENNILYVTRVCDVKLPQRAHDEDAGYDFCGCCGWRYRTGDHGGRVLEIPSQRGAEGRGG